MNLRVKLLVGYLFVAALVGIVGIINLNASSAIDASFEKLRDVTLPANQTIQQMRIDGETLLRVANELAFVYAINAGQEELDEEAEELAEAAEHLNEGLSRYLQLVDVNTPGQAELTAALQTAVDSLNEEGTQLLTAIQQNASIEELNEVREVLVATEDTFVEALNQAFSRKSDELTTEMVGIDDEIATSTSTVIILRVISIVIAITIALFFSNAITRPIRLLTHTAQQMTAGDYSQRAVVNTKDEIGTLADAFNTMTEAVRQRQNELTELNQTLEQQVAHRTQALTQSEGKYRLLVENNPDIIVTTDREFRIQYINMGGDNSAQVMGLNTLDFIHPDYIPVAKAAFEEALNGSPLVNYEVQAQGSGESPSWYKSRVQPILENGNIIGLMLISTDITELKRLEADVEQQRMFLRRVIDFTPSMIFVKDYDGKFVLVNQKLAEIYNTPPEQLIGKGDSDFNPNNAEVAAFLKADQEVIESATPLFIPEESVTNAEGETRWFQTTKVPIVSVDGEVRQVLGLSTDITERKRAEAEREKLIRDLQAAKRIAEENSRLKSDFLATMSHEIRTPLNAIEGFTSIMLTGMGGAQYNDKTERYLDRINANSKRLLALVNDFLDLSRIESGRYELADQPFSPAALAQRWQEQIGALAEKKGLAFDLNLDPHLPEKIYGDEEAISKIVLNLLTNAMKFTEQGKIGLHVANGGGNWSITVTDTGIGIPPHAREYIFDEFRQVDQTSRRKYGGTGLGLAIVQKLTRFMGGNITLTSELGQGSSFTVSLPVKLTT